MEETVKGARRPLGIIQCSSVLATKVLKEGGESAAGGGILLQRQDESVLLQPGLREP